MVDTIVNAIIEFFKSKVPDQLIVFIVSILPIVELRGGLIAAKILDMPWFQAFLICYIANIIPVPFILLFIRKIFQYLKTKKRWSKIIEKLEIRSMRKSEKVQKYRLWGLFAFVAVPLPGTGAWTGALIAALLDMRMKKSMPAIMAGVAVAGFIMTLLAYGLLNFVL